MHLVFVTTELATDINPSGGLATFTSNMARIFHSHGNSVDIILVTSKECDISFDEGIGLYRIFIPKSEWDTYFLIGKEADGFMGCTGCRKALINIYKAHKVKETVEKIGVVKPIDMVHFCNHGSFSLFFNRDIPYVIRISGFSNILFSGGNRINGSLKYSDNPISPKDKLEIIAMKKAKYIISPSYLVADIAKDELGVETTVLESPFVFDGIERDYSIYHRLTKYGMKYILFYGTLRILKGIHIIAQIAKDFLSVYEDFYMVLCGQDELIDVVGETIMASEYVKKQAGEHSDRVIYMGAVSRERLYPVISGAELVILPSRIENLSNACIESMALGKIVVATEGASFEQLIDNGVSGFLCRRDEPDSFLRAIYKAMRLSEKAKFDMSLAAKKGIERLCPDKVYENYFKYYSNVINSWEFH